jgi:hypothetical protein
MSWTPSLAKCNTPLFTVNVAPVVNQQHRRIATAAGAAIDPALCQEADRVHGRTGAEGERRIAPSREGFAVRCIPGAADEGEVLPGDVDGVKHRGIRRRLVDRNIAAEGAVLVGTQWPQQTDRITGDRMGGGFNRHQVSGCSLFGEQIAGAGRVEPKLAGTTKEAGHDVLIVE